MAFVIEYDGDSDELLDEVLRSAARGKWCVGLSWFDGGTPDGDYVVRSVSPAGELVLSPWDDEAGMGTGERIHLDSSYGIDRVHVY